MYDGTHEDAARAAASYGPKIDVQWPIRPDQRGGAASRVQSSRRHLAAWIRRVHGRHIPYVAVIGEASSSMLAVRRRYRRRLPGVGAAGGRVANWHSRLAS